MKALHPIALEQLKQWQDIAVRWPLRAEIRHVPEKPVSLQCHLVCAYNGCRQSVVFLAPDNNAYVYAAGQILDDTVRHIRQCHAEVTNETS